MEITNGIRIWKDFIVNFKKQDEPEPDAISTQDADQVTISAEKGKVVVKNATDSVVITNVSGMILNQVNAEEAALGISLSQGVYIVKTGNLVQKILVK